jgi:predicted small lipoprotein YifL
MPPAGHDEEWRARWGLAVATFDRRILSRALIAGLVLAAVGLTGCGRKGPLEPPPSAAAIGADGQKAPDTGAKKPDKPFVLDWLL